MRMSLQKTMPRRSTLGFCIALALVSPQAVFAADEIEFNTDVLDVHDRQNIDLSVFSRGGYILPGTYEMTLHINKNDLPEQQVTFYAPEDDPKGSQLCLTPALVEQVGFRAGELTSATWWHDKECLTLDSIPGMEARADLATNSVYLSVPQAFLEYTAENWDPPSRWDEGISGVMFDYNVNGQARNQLKNNERGYNLSGNGSTGINLGAWRLRADWQANLNHSSQSNKAIERQWDFTRYYAYRAVAALHSKLTLGEDYLSSSLFDSFRFMGASLVSDDNMLPPNLRGYAPEVVGIAKTNAVVKISQQGRVLYETSVAAGPFRIQDLSDAVSGELLVRVEEQDGNVQEFTVNTANIPYLTRPGQVRFKVAAGRPSDFKHKVLGGVFGAGEFSWGVSNGWSLFGGALSSQDYTALAVGIGRDLMAFGALSFDVTQSFARLPQTTDSQSGRSYRLSYSKTFDEIDSQVTFAGYRFSEREFMSMSEYLDARHYGMHAGNGKEMYTVSFNKQFQDLGLNAYVNYSHETYWDRPQNDRYNLTLSKYFDWGKLRNISVSLSAFRNEYNNVKDDGAYLSVSMPFGTNSTVSYNMSTNNAGTSHQASYFDRVDSHTTYQLSVGHAAGGATTSAFATHDADIARVNGNVSYVQGQYSAFGLSAQGGVTVTSNGGAFHRTSIMGGTRMLVDTMGVPDVPVRGYGTTTPTNRWGKAVVGDVNSYYRNKTSIDLDSLGNNAEATKSVVQATLTEGAIGYRQFDVIAGAKGMAVIKLADGSTPPFGARVKNSRQQDTGIVGDEGQIYLSGIKPSDIMTVSWGEDTQCEMQIPNPLPTDMLTHSLWLTCQLKGSVIPPVKSAKHGDNSSVPANTAALPKIPVLKTTLNGHEHASSTEKPMVQTDAASTWGNLKLRKP
ncbi:outer membrane usher protein [Providencia vermicola]|uniref:outer membrane usher protein n=1 Tax=Providencia vermicola TaxID=333965 RepID=UPI003D817811